MNHTGIPLEDILGVVTFGDVVRNPGYTTEITKGKKYGLFGEEVERSSTTPLVPKIADFLVITSQDAEHAVTQDPDSRYFSALPPDYGGRDWLFTGGINIETRGVEQFLRDARSGKDISTLVAREGVPIFSDPRLAEVLSQTGVRRDTPRIVRWDTNPNGILEGQIS